MTILWIISYGSKILNLPLNWACWTKLSQVFQVSENIAGFSDSFSCLSIMILIGCETKSQLYEKEFSRSPVFIFCFVLFCYCEQWHDEAKKQVERLQEPLVKPNSMKLLEEVNKGRKRGHLLKKFQKTITKSSWKRVFVQLDGTFFALVAQGRNRVH